jgi:dCTP diphosphatase
VTLEELTAAVREFAVERDWEQFHTPKNLAMAVAGEAGELAAELQWLTPQESQGLCPQRLQAVAEEMADVLIYLCRMADVLGVDLLAAAAAKLQANGHRYAAAEVRGSAQKRE